MNVRRFHFAFDDAIRISHMALWMTIPTTFWLWLWTPPPAECAPKYGWCKGNALCVFEDVHRWITFGVFLLGYLAFACWIYGYCYDVISRVLRGDKRLPPIRIMSALDWRRPDRRGPYVVC